MNLLSNPKACKEFTIGAILILLLSSVGLAQSPVSYLQAETEVLEHQNRLTALAEALENWLAGRLSQEAFAQAIERAKDSKPYRHLERPAATSVYADENKIIKKIESFAGKEAPDFDAQKQLLLSLSSFSESRTSNLLAWRRQQLKTLLGSKLTSSRRTYFEWELSWIGVWEKEAKLTKQLETAFLDDTGPEAQQLLKDLLKLRAQADAIARPQSLQELDATCKERLTLLTRTAEQLLRLKKRQSSSAVTKVRRLSRQLSALTQKFQTERLAKIKAL